MLGMRQQLSWSPLTGRSRSRSFCWSISIKTHLLHGRDLQIGQSINVLPWFQPPGKPDCKDTSPAQLTFDADLATQQPTKFLDNGKPQTGARVLSLERVTIGPDEIFRR